jgi:hypothetical protein
VDDGRDAVAPGRRHVVDEQHVRARELPGEDVLRALQQHERRDRPELLAALDVVEPLQVVPVAGVREQRPVAERPRAELAAAGEPRHDAVVGEHLRDLPGEVRRRGERQAGGPQCGRELVVGPGAAQGGRRHRLDGVTVPAGGVAVARG